MMTKGHNMEILITGQKLSKIKKQNRNFRVEEDNNWNEK